MGFLYIGETPKASKLLVSMEKPWFREAPCSRPLLSKMTRAEIFECVFWESMVSNMRTSEECKEKNTRIGNMEYVWEYMG